MNPSKPKRNLQRFSTGIKNLDPLIDGGYQIGRSVLIMGGPGVGKTIMALQFTVNACNSGAKCIYLATEETPDELMAQANQLELELNKYIKNGQLRIQPALAERMVDVQWHKGKPKGTSIFKSPINAITESDADVVIIDNIGSYAFDVTIGNFREQMDFLIHNIRKKGMTALIVCDETLDERYNSVALYSVHGAIHLFKRENPFTGNVERLMNIVKMRGTKTPLGYLRYNISGQGITLENIKE